MNAFTEMSAAEKMPVRKMDFEFPDDIDLVFIEDDPEASYLFVGAWMMLPYLEPFLIRTVRKASEQIDDPNLKEEASRFCSQEGQHYQQHQYYRYNLFLRCSHPHIHMHSTRPNAGSYISIISAYKVAGR